MALRRRLIGGLGLVAFRQANTAETPCSGDTVDCLREQASGVVPEVKEGAFAMDEDEEIAR